MKKLIKVTRSTKYLVDNGIAAVSVTAGWLAFGYLYALLSSKTNRRYLKKPPKDLMLGYACGLGIMSATCGVQDVFDDVVTECVAKITDKIFEVVDEETE